MKFTRIAPRFVLGLALSVGLAMPAMADKLSLGEISKYLNSLQTAKGSFTQINDDGTISTGTIFIKRPGKIRFEYNPPEKTLVLASAGAVAIFDPKTNQGPETYPLDRTPLKIILAKNVNLGQANMVTGHREEGPSTIVKAQDPENPEYGYIELVFTANPTQLRQWVVHDDSGSATTVVLGDMQTGMSLSQRLFNFQDGFVADR